MVFALLFPPHSYPIPHTSFTQVDPTHFVLNVTSTVAPDISQLREVCIFLTQPNLLPPDAALGVYVRVDGGDWAYRGCISAARPSEVLATQWPGLVDRVDNQGLAPTASVPTLFAQLGASSGGAAQLGVAVEPRAELEARESQRAGSRAEFARRVAFDLLAYVQSFGHMLPVELVVNWYIKFQSKFSRDPDFLSRQDKIV